MKKILFIISITFLGLGIMAFTPSKLTNEEEEEYTIGATELAGLWTDSNTTAFQNSAIIFSVEGATIEMLHYLEWQGHPFVEKGKGRIYGRKLDYFVTVTRPIPGWTITGEHFLTLSKDGRTLRGACEDENGILVPLVLKGGYIKRG